MKINDYFDVVFCINIRRRPDRWAHAVNEASRIGIQVERFEGADMINWGNNGCTMSHRLIMEKIIEEKINRALVLEDDFEFRFSDSNQRFSDMIGLVPDDWDLLYLGGHYAEKPVGRLNEHVIIPGSIKTTSSYGIKRRQAERMVSSIAGIGPIDDLFSGWIPKSKTYIFQPRLVVQYNNYSDLQQRECNNEPCMTDTRHEEMV